MASELQTLMGKLRDKLLAVPVIADNELEVLAHEPGNISKRIQAALKRKLAIVTVIGWGKISRPRRQSLRPVYEPLRFFVRVVENALVNKSGVHVLELAERINAEFPVDTTGGVARPWRPDVAGADLIYPDGDMEQLTIVEGPGESADDKANFDGWDIPFATKFAPLPAVLPTP